MAHSCEDVCGMKWIGGDDEVKLSSSSGPVLAGRGPRSWTICHWIEQYHVHVTVKRICLEDQADRQHVPDSIQ